MRRCWRISRRSIASRRSVRVAAVPSGRRPSRTYSPRAIPRAPAALSSPFSAPSSAHSSAQTPAPGGAVPSPKENPGGLPPGMMAVQIMSAVRRSRSEGAANAEVAGPNALILELVRTRRLERAGDRRRTNKVDTARERLVDHGVQDFAGERQVGNRSPAVRDPTCQMLKSGLQVLPGMTAAPAVIARRLQIRAEALPL